jgi:hypothetical protein
LTAFPSSGIVEVVMSPAEKNEMMQVFAAGTGSARVGRAALLALALQLRPAWVLLGPWVGGGEGVRSLLSRFRILPAHPDWYLPALVQSCVTALTLVGLSRRFRPNWALLTAALAGTVAWAVAFAFVPAGLDGFSVTFLGIREFVAMAVILICLQVTWRRLGPWTAVPVVALVGGLATGSMGFLLTNTIFRSPWPEDWPIEMGTHVVGVALLAIALALLRRRSWDAASPGTVEPASMRSGIVAGTVGLLVLVLTHLAAGILVSGWTTGDSLRLVGAAAVLALVATAALAANARSRVRRPQ